MGIEFSGYSIIVIYYGGYSMKRIFTLCLTMGVCFILISCGTPSTATQQQSKTQQQGVSQQPSSNQQTAPQESGQDSSGLTQQNGSLPVKQIGTYGFYDMAHEFLDKVDANPIDKDYNTELQTVSSTFEMTQLEAKYNKIWDIELNTIYKKLQAKLSQKEKEELIESQKGWLQYYTNEPEFVIQVFTARESGPILGSQGKVQIAMVTRERLRARTLELMEYYSMLGNQVEFVYKGTKN
jgi:uncharacterized protein YecT (DUF1311 family)